MTLFPAKNTMTIIMQTMSITRTLTLMMTTKSIITLFRTISSRTNHPG